MRAINDPILWLALIGITAGLIELLRINYKQKNNEK